MISIVTINLNNKKGLERTIKSVLAQTCIDDIQYIVIDGKSTDGSVDVIKQYADGIDYWVSEKDKGIYNAMNKGLKEAKGEYVLMLNSGDYLASADVIEQVLKLLDDSIIIYGNEVFSKRINAMVSYVSCDYVDERTDIYPDELDEDFFRRRALPHQSTFIQTKYHKKHPYSEKYKVTSDWKFLREAIMDDKVKYKHIPVVVSNYNLEGISAQDNTHEIEKNEYYKLKDK
jgi:glycosyltransferase involved in cell wall biosynthesis